MKTKGSKYLDTGVTSLKNDIVPMIILSLLNKDASEGHSGLEIKGLVESTFNTIFHTGEDFRLHNTRLYRLLTSLIEEGLIEMKKELEKRNTYSITLDGEKALLSWKKEFKGFLKCSLEFLDDKN